MPKFCVQIFGKVPDEIEVEAKDANEAEEIAFGRVMDEFDFEVSPAEGKQECPTS